MILKLQLLLLFTICFI